MNYVPFTPYITFTDDYTYEDEHHVLVTGRVEVIVDGEVVGNGASSTFRIIKEPADLVPASWLAYMVAGYVGLAAVIGLGLLIGHWTASAIGF